MDSNEQGWEQLSFTLNWTPTAPESSSDTGPESPTSGMSETSQDPECRPLIFSREAFLASPYLMPGNDWPRTTPDGSGPSSSGSSKSSGRRGSSRRTSPVSASGALDSSSQDLPISGMTRSGFVFRLRPWERRISVSDSSSWPTPRAADWKNAGYQAFGKTEVYLTLPGAVGAAPVPPDKEIRGARGWPTPTSADATGGPGTSPKRTGGENLRTDVNGQLNPQWVEWLMGFPLGWTDLEPSETE